MTRTDWGNAAELIKILEEAEQEVPSELVDMSERYQAMKDRRDDERRSFGLAPRGGGGGGGRRGGDGGGFSNFNDNPVSFEISSKKVGTIIGRGGSNINEVQKQYNVRVNVDKNYDGGQCKVNVSGPNYDQVKEAVSHLKQQCDDYQPRN